MFYIKLQLCSEDYVMFKVADRLIGWREGIVIHKDL